METAIERWLKEDGPVFLKEIGIKRGQVVLDFGCGEGHYTIPAAKVVGERGKVYALDKDGKVLHKLMEIARAEGLENIEPIKTEGGPKIPLTDESIDVILLYDILHSYYFESDERRELLKEVYRISKIDGLISVYPKHMESEEITEEMEKIPFHFEKRFFKKLIHDGNYEDNYILNFRKSAKNTRR